ncbi:MAG: hypothetical protein JW888_00575 [Pirellulales bacterium]|nr:hypothetical protein [Pirellulales bacterium]
MVNARRNGRPRDYSGRREQGRLLLLVMSLGLVLIAMNEARKPKNWELFFPEVRAERDNEPNENVDEFSGKYFPGVKSEFLETIRDKTHFRVEEQDAWFHLFAVLRTADPAKLCRASIGRIARIQLSEQSKAYRGELVTIRGTIHRAHWLNAPKNDYGITGYYQTWVQPDDDPDRSIVVYCLELPDGFPKGMDISEPAIITGFYFKQWLKKTQEGLQLCPVVLARTVERDRTKQASESSFLSQPSLGLWGGILVVGSAALIAAAIASYVFRRTCRTTRPLRQSDPGVDH